MENTIIMVNSEPYCIWERDLKDQNLKYINSIDAAYFDYLIKVHYENCAEQDDKYAALALRVGYFHALETLFSIIGAFLQAPDCVYAWISKCSTGDLREVIMRINRTDHSLFKKVNIESVSWEAISEMVFASYFPGTEKNLSTKNHFAVLWQRLSHEFLDDKNIDEYNSLKHGMRIKPGGFSLSAGIELTPGVAAPDQEMKVLGHSKYGTSFLVLEQLGNTSKSRSFRSKPISINWEIEKVVLLIQLIAISIRNLKAALLRLNGIKNSDTIFYRPIEDSDFDKPWEFNSGVRNMSMEYVFKDTDYRIFTKNELLEIIAKILKDRSKEGVI